MFLSYYYSILDEGKIDSPRLQQSRENNQAARHHRYWLPRVCVQEQYDGFNL